MRSGSIIHSTAVHSSVHPYPSISTRAKKGNAYRTKQISLSVLRAISSITVEKLCRLICSAAQRRRELFKESMAFVDSFHKNIRHTKSYSQNLFNTLSGFTRSSTGFQFPPLLKKILQNGKSQLSSWIQTME